MTTLCAGCHSTKVVERYYVPEIVFPVFPKVAGYEISEDGLSVTVPADYFRDLLIYRAEIQDAERKYNEKKALYETVDDTER